MQTMQTRSHKTKPKLGDPSGTVAPKPARGNREARTGAVPAVSAQEREMQIARAAYFRAEKRGFAPGGELQDWVEAEAELLRRSGGG